MKKEEIWQMALASGLCDTGLISEDQVEKFAAMIIVGELSQLRADFDALKAAHLADIVRTAIEEREACAQVCEDLAAYYEDNPGESFAAAIRMRST